MSTTTKVVTSHTSTNAQSFDKDTQGESMVSKPCATSYQKEIKYDRETRDFAMYLDGDLVGFARNYHEAEVNLDRLVFELLSGQGFREAA